MKTGMVTAHLVTTRLAAIEERRRKEKKRETDKGAMGWGGGKSGNGKRYGLRKLKKKEGRKRQTVEKETRLPGFAVQSVPEGARWAGTRIEMEPGRSSQTGADSFLTPWRQNDRASSHSSAYTREMSPFPVPRMKLGVKMVKSLVID